MPEPQLFVLFTTLLPSIYSSGLGPLSISILLSAYLDLHRF